MTSAGSCVPTPTHHAPITSEHGVQVERNRNEFCHYLGDIQLRKTRAFGIWKTEQARCPKYDHEDKNTQAPNYHLWKDIISEFKILAENNIKVIPDTGCGPPEIGFVQLGFC